MLSASSLWRGYSWRLASVRRPLAQFVGPRTEALAPGDRGGRRARPLFLPPLSSLGAAADGWLVVLLTCAAIAARLFTNTLYAEEPSSDEYFYGLYALEIARWLLRLSPIGVDELAGQSRSGGLIVGAALTIVPLDPISLGRMLQALFGALTAPLVYLLARAIGLRAQAALAGGALFIVVPELWETAWRFWSDSQVTFLALCAVLVLLQWAQRPSLKSALLAAALGGATYLTKEYVALAILPVAFVAVAPRVLSPFLGGRRKRVGLVIAGLGLVAVPTALVVLVLLGGSRLRAVLGPTFLGGFVNRTLSAADHLLPLIPAEGARLPGYFSALRDELGPQEFGTGFVLFWALGGLAFVFMLGTAVLRARSQAGAEPSASRRLLPVALWVGALIVWAPSLVLGWSVTWDMVRQSMLLAALLALGSLLVGVNAVLAWPRGARQGASLAAAYPSERLAYGLVLLGAFVTSLLAFRFVIWAAPDLSAAFTPRSFQPVFPLLAILSGWGLAAVTGAIAASWERWRPAEASLVGSLLFVAVLAGTVLLLTPVRGHLGSSSLLAYRADRAGNLTTPGGLRITALVEAERWLQANLMPGDRVLTSMPRQLAWHGNTGVIGYLNALTTGDLAPDWPTRRAKFMQALAQPSDIDYVIDFNLNWTKPESAEAQVWYALYRWLRSRPYLEEVYTRRDPGGRVVFYAFRNHRWATSRGYEDREAARAIQLAGLVQ